MAHEPLILGTRTLGELLAAVEGLRSQLSTFSDQALGEIELLKFWIYKAIESGQEKVVLFDEVPKPPPPI